MATVRRTREIVDHVKNIQNENAKPHSIHLRSKGNYEDLTQKKMPYAANSKAMATNKLSRQQRGVMTNIGNNQINLLQTNNKNKLHVTHHSIIEEPRAKKKYYGEVEVKPCKEALHPTEVEDVTMASPAQTHPEMRSHTTDVIMDEARNSPIALSSNWEDVDSEDMDDPQMVAVYVNDIFAYLRELESKYPIKPGYLSGQKGIVPKMRAVLTDWMVEVHQQFTLLQETLFLSIAILDRYMQLQAETVARRKLQLVGVTAMFIAAKYEEMYAPEIGDFVYITDNAYSESEIRTQEVEMIKHLNFSLERPLPLHFLRRFSKVAQIDTTIHNLAKYIMELAIVEYKFCHVLPSKLAAAALAISMMAYENDPEVTLKQLWNSTIEHYTFYKLSSIADLVQELADHLLKVSATKDTRLMAVRKKYSDKKFIRVAISPEVVGSNVLSLAERRF